MEHRALSFISEIVAMAFIGTLTLFFIAEIVFAQDMFFVHPVVIIASVSIAIIFWYWGQDRRVT